MHKTATSIVGRLQDNGFEAYLVGGCVRDILLGHEPKDYDIATNAQPEQIETLFENTIHIGKAFGVILIEEAGHKFEVATFREESNYRDGRRPDTVRFSDAQTDALRRDFTINGLFYDPVIDKYHDFVGGRKDLQNRVLRFIGNPDARLNEDFLRLLRAVRFRHRFGLDYDLETGLALKKHASLVTQIAAERVTEELNKIIAHKSRAAALKDLFELDILDKLFPEVSDLAQTDQPSDHHSEGDVLTHTFLVLKGMDEGEDLALYWAAFFHDYAKAQCKHWNGERWTYPGHDQIADEMAEPLLSRLKFPNKLKADIIWLLRYKAIFESFYDMHLSKRLHYFDQPQFENLIKLELYDIKGCVPENKKEHEDALRETELIYENWAYAHRMGLVPSSKPELYTGEEIMEITGLSPSAKVGELKASLRDLQMEGKINTRKEAKAWLQQQKQRLKPLAKNKQDDKKLGKPSSRTQITAEGFNPQSEKIFLVTWSTYSSRASEKTKFYKLEGVYLSLKERQAIHDLLLQKIRKENYQILALNVLDDHVHLIVHCTEEQLPQIIKSLKGFSSRMFNKTPVGSGENQRLWGKGFSSSDKENHQALIKALEYVDLNHEKHKLDSIKLHNWENNRKLFY